MDAYTDTLIEEKNMTYVKTKKELQEAVKRKDGEIIVVGKLAKKLKGFAKIQRLSSTQKVALLAFLAGSGAAATAAIAAAGPTGGLSIPGGVLMFMTTAPAAGVSAETAIAVIGILGVIGLTCIALLKEYDVDVVINGHGVEIHYIRKTTSKN